MTTLAGPKLPTDRRDQPIDLISTRARLEAADAPARLRWGYETFGDGFALTTSFGIQSAVLLHMLSRLNESIPVLWVDTGYLPDATYRYADTLCRLLPLNLQVLQSPLSPARMEALHGRLWETGSVDDLTLYHQLRKVEPLDRGLRELRVRCWASGVRGGQTDHRKGMATLDPVRELWSLRPLLEWTSRDVFYYMQEHDLPQHPLFEAGYSTVGDWHSSAPDDGRSEGSGDGRATRFGGLKQECGIHMPGVMGDGI